jgi:hypothetical protein
MVMMAMTVMWCRGRRRRARARLRCKNAGLSDKAEDRSQKQNVFYHEVFNTVENGKFQKNCDTSQRTNPLARRPAGRLAPESVSGA